MIPNQKKFWQFASMLHIYRKGTLLTNSARPLFARVSPRIPWSYSMLKRNRSKIFCPTSFRMNTGKRTTDRSTNLPSDFWTNFNFYVRYASRYITCKIWTKKKNTCEMFIYKPIKKITLRGGKAHWAGGGGGGGGGGSKG